MPSKFLIYYCCHSIKPIEAVVKVINRSLHQGDKSIDWTLKSGYFGCKLTLVYIGWGRMNNGPPQIFMSWSQQSMIVTLHVKGTL